MDLSKTQLIESVFAGGEMGARMRAFDWSTTALGPVEQWPQALRTSVRIVLGSAYPMIIGWGQDYVLLYNDRRASAEDRVKQVQDALAQPGADFNALAKQYSDGPEKNEGGEIGWLTKDSLSSDIADQIWALPVGGVSDPLELGQGHYLIKVEDKQTRPLDPDEQATARQSAFTNWYQPLHDQATSDGTITTVTPLNSGGDLTTGSQQGP